MHDAWQKAFIDAGGGAVALSVTGTTGDNPIDGMELNDLLRQVVTGDGKIRTVEGA